jgi:hypothetical protein
VSPGTKTDRGKNKAEKKTQQTRGEAGKQRFATSQDGLTNRQHGKKKPNRKRQTAKRCLKEYVVTKNTTKTGTRE